jgi:HSP20 family protein
MKLSKKSSMPSILSDFFNNDRLERMFDYDLLPSANMFNRIPAANIKDNGKEYKIELAVPGMKKNDFDINLENDTLTISAEKKDVKEDENENYTRREYSYNAFRRTFRIPDLVSPENVKARYENGVLEISLPKKEDNKTEKRKSIKVS